MKRFLPIVCLAALMLCLGACGSSQEASSSSDSAATSSTSTDESGLTEITFVLDWTPNTNHTGVYVADAMGFFEEVGLKVNIVQPPDDGAEMLVASGKAQFGVSFQDYIMPGLVGDNPMPISAVAAILQHNTSGIISRSDKNIKSPKDMEGHSYATWDLDLEKATLKQVVEADGGDFSKIDLVPSTVTDEPTALESDMVDSIWIFEGWAGVACDLAGIDTNYFSFIDIDPVFDYYTPIIIGNDNYLSENPEISKAFLAAVEKGYQYCIDNPSEAAEVLLEAAPELDRELVIKSQEFMVDQYVADAPRWGVIDADRWNAFYRWVSENGLSSEPIPDNAGFTNDYLP